ncbi:hypothetical protein [Lapillicoccus sp.]|uniref:hypothetical protein n=1 Tax=Lapillicoccus sp. TaxID=1909287 RepID=UPI0032671C96
MATALVPDSRVEEADWFSDALAGFGGRVEQVLPGTYPAYARILHPANGGGAVPSRWSEVAASVGTVVHPLAQFGALARRESSHRLGAPGWDGQNPFEGSLGIHELTILCGILAETTQPGERCWATVWEGWGTLPTIWQDRFPRIVQPYRAYFLFERRLDEIVDLAAELGRLYLPSRSSAHLVDVGTDADAARSEPPAPAEPTPEVVLHVQSPSQWWPASRDWCVATEIDFDSTLVGGSESLVQRILDDGRLEAFPVSPTDDLGSGGDTVNELLGSG